MVCPKQGQGHAHLKISWINHVRINGKEGVLAYPPPLSPSPPSSYGVGIDFDRESSGSSPPSSGSKISPAVLFIIVVLAVLFFISGLLHLLVRFLTKNSSSASRSNRNLEAYSSDTLQRQLQQLFHLHDSGLDQAFIDALPVFTYKEVVGPQEPLDCAVCLCEFSEADQLRLLPMCSHAFHINCIDTWLMSNSTCPLCRGTLVNQDFSFENPMFGYNDDFREDDECSSFGENGFSIPQKRAEIEEVATGKAGVFPVKLGKFRKFDYGGGGEERGETSSSNLDARRCFSMGSFQYVVCDANVRLALSRDRGVRDLKLAKGTEQSCNGSSVVDESAEGKKICIGTKTDSYSVSKIWLWSGQGKFASSSANIHLENPSTPNLDLSCMHKTQDI